MKPNPVKKSKKDLESCAICSRKGYIKKRRLNTRYVDDERNFLTSCLKCYDQAYDDYAEMWNDYYADCL